MRCKRSVGSVRRPAAERQHPDAHDNLRDDEPGGHRQFPHGTFVPGAPRLQAHVNVARVRRRAVQPERIHTAAHVPGGRTQYVRPGGPFGRG